MKKTKDTKQIRNLIDQFLQDKTSAKDRAGIETWYLIKAEQANEIENEPDFIYLQEKIWSKISAQLPTVQEDTPQAKIGLKSNSVAYLVKIGIAAMLILIAGISYYVLTQTPGKSNRLEIAKDKDILPGTDKALLTLANGKAIDLSSAESGLVASQDGIDVVKNGTGKLVYKFNSSSAEISSMQNTISTPAGGQYAVMLPDGSKVWLNAASSLTFPVRFSSSERKVSLTGEGYFEITHLVNKNKRVPFTVIILKGDQQSQKVEVLGTHFNINAYSNEPDVKTTLLQGIVRVQTKDNYATTLKPGQQAVLHNDKITLQNADTEVAVAWKNGEFVFREDLRSAMRKISRWYNVDVVYDDSAPDKLMLGGWMSRGDNLSEILNHIQSTGKVHFKLEGRRVTVKE